MKWSAILREAWANVLTGTTRAATFGIALALTIGGLVVADLLQITSITDAATHYQESGASISVMQMMGGIDGQACEALNGVPGIQRAGALRNDSERLTLSVLPAAPVPMATVTTSFPSLLRATGAGNLGVVLSDQVVDKLGASPGSSIATSTGQVSVAGTYEYPDDGRKSGYGYLALVPSNDTDPFDECWADIWPQSEELQTLLYLTAIPNNDANGPAATMGQLNVSLGTTFQGYAQYQQRLTRYVPIVAALAAFVLGYLSIRIRRLEIASNLHAGMARADQRTGLLLETLFWVLPAITLIEVVALVVIASDPVADRSALLIVANRPLALAVVGVFLGVFTVWLLTREKHLFSYFKTR